MPWLCSTDHDRVYKTLRTCEMHIVQNKQAKRLLIYFSSLDLVNSIQVALHIKDWLLDTLTTLSQNPIPVLVSYKASNYTGNIDQANLWVVRATINVW